MAKSIRYTLATFCFAASVGCLALWWRSIYYWDIYITLTQPDCGQILETIDGIAFVELNHMFGVDPNDDRTFVHLSIRANDQRSDPIETYGRFHVRGTKMHFPLWYSALVFAIAGVAALRFRRQFSIRSALITVSVVAALLGMVVAL